MRYPNLFAPITINQVTIRNRILSTAHAKVYAEDGVPGERYIRYYEEKAKGGVASRSAPAPARSRSTVRRAGGSRWT